MLVNLFSKVSCDKEETEAVNSCDLQEAQEENIHHGEYVKFSGRHLTYSLPQYCY